MSWLPWVAQTGKRLGGQAAQQAKLFAGPHVPQQGPSGISSYGGTTPPGGGLSQSFMNPNQAGRIPGNTGMGGMFGNLGGAVGGMASNFMNQLPQLPGGRPLGPYGAQHQQWDIANRKKQGDARRQQQSQQRQARQQQLKQLGQDRPWLKTYGKSGTKSHLAGALHQPGVMAVKRGRAGVKGGGREVAGSKINWGAIAAYQGMTPQQQRQLAMTSPHLVPQVNGKYIGAGGDILNNQGKGGGQQQLAMQQPVQGLGRGGGGIPGGDFGGALNVLRGSLFGGSLGQNAALHQANMAGHAGAAQIRQRGRASGRDTGSEVAQFLGRSKGASEQARSQRQMQEVSLTLQAMGLQADLAAKLAEAAALSGVQSPSQIMGAV
tara:strand:+ start:1661 stop:2791 length:1131 start_codon:yes stop_codon:yes gene_type:complete